MCTTITNYNFVNSDMYTSMGSVWKSFGKLEQKRTLLKTGPGSCLTNSGVGIAEQQMPNCISAGCHDPPVIEVSERKGAYHACRQVVIHCIGTVVSL